MRRGGPLRRRTPLRWRPKAKSLRARPDEPLATWCEVARPGVCTGRAVHRHHKLPRSAGGGHDQANTVDACARCHRFIHDNPAWAYAHGWLVRRSAA